MEKVQQVESGLRSNRDTDKKVMPLNKTNNINLYEEEYTKNISSQEKLSIEYGHLNYIPFPSIIIDKQENIIFRNTIFLNEYSSNKKLIKYISDAINDNKIMNEIRSAFKKLSLRMPYIMINTMSGEKNWRNTAYIVGRLRNSMNDEHYILIFFEEKFSNTVIKTFRDVYGITQGEADIALKIVSGLNPEQIAIERNVSLATLRTQIKTIKQKTRVTNLTQLVKIIYNISISIGIVDESVRKNPIYIYEPNYFRIRNFELRDGRKLFYIEQGAPNGQVVISLHGTYNCFLVPRTVADILRARNIRLLSPIRPGYGISEPCIHLSSAELLEQFSRDLFEFCKKNFPDFPVSVVSQPGSSNFALHFASFAPDRIRQIIMLGQPPAWSEDWLSDLPHVHSLMLRLLRSDRRMANLFAASILSYSNESERHHYNSYIEAGASTDPYSGIKAETGRALSDGLKIGRIMNPECLCRELALIQIDMTSDISKMAAKISIACREKEGIKIKNKLTKSNQIDVKIIETDYYSYYIEQIILKI